MARRTQQEKEWLRLEKQEQRYAAQRTHRVQPKWTQRIEERIPPKVQMTLERAFERAFYLVFTRGTGLIETTYHREEMQKTHQVHAYAVQVKGNRASYRTVSHQASRAGLENLVLSGVSGAGLGALGIGLPDILLFTGLLLKNVYQIALSYGCTYQSEEEQRFILRLLQGVFAPQDSWQSVDASLNDFIRTGRWDAPSDLATCLRETAHCLSKELLFVKFVQGFPVVGVTGGIFNAISMNRVTAYAQLKYRRRFLSAQNHSKRGGI